ncbi:hypothetical protein FRX94_11305 [Corynebacterium canis]|uniref:Uncharacterized protein n=1 Tax=Corynebacterium canis TaxID=679663 RepID=A0A5C5U3G6_9CORY|nr:hypothetical protein [Corynebacterium canis]TWT21021.1 hypothetical protein FRX94_11305 [Corynebacterium canis]
MDRRADPYDSGLPHHRLSDPQFQHRQGLKLTHVPYLSLLQYLTTSVELDQPPTLCVAAKQRDQTVAQPNQMRVYSLLPDNHQANLGRPLKPRQRKLKLI